MRLILASASPRRRELLARMLLDFEVVPSAVESPYESGSPERYALDQARVKARDIAARFPDAAVIGADTIVCVSEKVLGKPRDERDAFEMLKLLEGSRHTVYSGLCVVTPKREFSALESAAVFFAPMSDAEIHAYIKTGEPMDKAGAYGIQGRGMCFIERIEGCYFSVMGLPVRKLYKILSQIDPRYQSAHGQKKIDPFFDFCENP